MKYHRISNIEDDGSPSKISFFELGVPVEHFEKQIKYLSKRYRILSLENLIAHLKYGVKIPDNSVVITFDDGYEDVYRNAYPILLKFDVPATIFIVVDYIGTGKILWWDKLADIIMHADRTLMSNGEFLGGLDLGEDIQLETFDDRAQLIDTLSSILKKLNQHKLEMIIDRLAKKVGWSDNRLSKHSLMSWEQVKEMTENGVSIGSHTCSHPALTKIGYEQAKDEVTRSKTKIEEKIQRKVELFAYPYGDFDETIEQILEASGYSCACSTIYGTNGSGDHIYALKRIGVEGMGEGIRGGFSKALFALEMSGLSDIAFFRTWRGL